MSKMTIYSRVHEAKKYIEGVLRINRFRNNHETMEFLLNSNYDDKQALFNVVRSSKLFEYRGFHMCSTKDAVRNWRETVQFHIPLLDDNFEEESGIFHINIYMREQCFFESYITWMKYPINDFNNPIK